MTRLDDIRARAGIVMADHLQDPRLCRLPCDLCALIDSDIPYLLDLVERAVPMIETVLTLIDLGMPQDDLADEQQWLSDVRGERA